MTSKSPIALVTGASSGIGKATAERLTEAGYKVYGTSRRGGQSAQLSFEMLALDVNVDASVAQAVDTVLKREGRIDVLVNNAAVRPTGTMETVTDEDWDLCFNVNIRGMYVTTSAVLPQMIARRQGVIVNVASGAGKGRANLIAYGSSKGAIFAFTQCLAIDHAHQGIRINTVVPGFTETGMTGGMPEKAMAMGKKMSVAGRVNKPEEVANTIIWLASDQASIVSGITLEAGTLPRQA